MKLIPDFIRNYRIDIYKDIVFWVIVVLWLAGNILEAYYTRHAIWLNHVFMMLMCILILIKVKNKKFNDWLNTSLNKK